MVKLGFPYIFVSVLIPLIGAFLFPLLKSKIKNKFLSIISFLLLGIPPLFMGYISIVYMLGNGVIDYPFFEYPGLGTFSMYLDWLSSYYVFGVGIVTPLVAVYSLRYMKNHIQTIRDNGIEVPSLEIFYMLYTIFSAGMYGVVLSTNLIQFYIFLKFTVIASFFLIFLYGYGERIKISLMYLIWSSVAGFFILLGSMGFGANIGTFDIFNFTSMELNLGIGDNLHILIPLTIFTGLLIKKAIFGFHIWLPFAHAEAPTPVSALLSPNLIGISGWAMVRIVYDIFPLHFESFSMYFFVLAYITMIYGGLMALAQDDLKRLLAYVSVSQMGWVVLGFTTLTIEGVIGGVLLFVKHALSLSILFMSAGLLISDFENQRKISSIKRLWYKSRIVSILTIIGFFILLGVPLTVGFWTKTLIFTGAVKMPAVQSTAGFLIVAVLLLIAGSITAAYSTITLKKILGINEHIETEGEPVKDIIGWNSSTIPMAVVAFFGIIMFFTPNILAGHSELPSLSYIILEGGIFIFVYIVSYFLYQGKIQQFTVYLFDKIEMLVFDRFFHNLLVNAIQNMSINLKKVHAGILNSYMLWMIFGFIVITFFLLFS